MLIVFPIFHLAFVFIVLVANRFEFVPKSGHRGLRFGETARVGPIYTPAAQFARECGMTSGNGHDLTVSRRMIPRVEIQDKLQIKYIASAFIQTLR